MVTIARIQAIVEAGDLRDLRTEIMVITTRRKLIQ
jgi:hypothetical protein